jgi:tRNA(Ile)-lysidine synthase
VELARTDENSVALNLERFLAEPKIVRVELIRRSITALGCGERDLTQRHYERILQLADKNAGSRKFELPGGFVVRRESGDLIFARPQRITLWHGLPAREDTAKMAVPQQITSTGHLTVESVNLEVPGQTSILRRSPKDERFGRYLIKATILDTRYQILDIRRASSIENRESRIELVERFDLDRIKLPLVVRHRQNGDRFRPLGLAAEKKVGKFLTDAKIPQKMRNKTLIIADGERIIWVWPIRISEHAKVSSQTCKILQLQITEAEPPT